MTPCLACRLRLVFYVLLVLFFFLYQNVVICRTGRNHSDQQSQSRCWKFPQLATFSLIYFSTIIHYNSDASLNTLDPNLAYRVSRSRYLYVRVYFWDCAAACRQVLERVNRALASRVRGQLSSEAKQQALFSLLGKEFVRQHFPHHKFNPNILVCTTVASRK